MRFSFNWLKEFVDIALSPVELADKLTMAGIEVESVHNPGAEISGVYVAEVVTVGKHPNADRLSLCEVKINDKVYSIVCGAKNMKSGDKVALALDGARLPKGVVIKQSKIRGVESRGMMCSEVELGLAETSEGIMILPSDAKLGVDIKDALDLNDAFLEVSITPNRPDCLSVIGLAREISSVCDVPVKEKSINLKEGSVKTSDRIKISVEDRALCRRYAVRVIEGVKIAQSPDWLRKRLEASGVRPVNNAVDVTNYVMLETGQPLHAFDIAKIAGARLIVRTAKDGEEITAIDNKKRVLKSDMLVISDGNAAQAIAGVMGGKASEVTDSATGIVLESAHFLPGTVRKTSRLLGLSSDSSYRFERGVDAESVGKSLDRAAELMTGISGGTCLSGMPDQYPEKFRPVSVRFDVKRAKNLLGYEIAGKDAAKILTRLGMEVKPSNDAFDVTPPSFRQDIKNETDLVEELARINGYDKIPVTMPNAAIGASRPSNLFLLKKRAGDALRDFGFNEVINYSFVSKEVFSVASNVGETGFRLSNPLSEEQSVLRRSLVPSLLENLRLNLSNKNEEVNIFERRVAFEPDGKKPKEVFKLAGLMYGLREGLRWNRPKDLADFYDAKGIIEALFACLGLKEASYEPEKETKFLHPGKSARVSVKGKPVAIVGELHPDIAEKYDFKKPVYVFEIELAGLVPFFEASKKYSRLPKFPESTRDIAFVVANDIPWSEIIGYVLSLDVKLIENVSVFDVYCGQGIPEGKKSVALRIIYRSLERTLTYEEVEATHDAVRKGISGRFGAEIRQS